MYSKERFDLDKQAGRTRGAHYMLVVLDGVIDDHYVIYVMPGEKLSQAQQKYNDPSKLTKILEIVDLRPIDPLTGWRQ